MPPQCAESRKERKAGFSGVETLARFASQNYFLQIMNQIGKDFFSFNCWTGLARWCIKYIYT